MCFRLRKGNNNNVLSSRLVLYAIKVWNGLSKLRIYVLHIIVKIIFCICGTNFTLYLGKMVRCSTGIFYLDLIIFPTSFCSLVKHLIVDHWFDFRNVTYEFEIIFKKTLNLHLEFLNVAFQFPSLYQII